MKSPLLREGLFVCPGSNKRSFMKEHMFARKSNVCSCSNDRMFLHIKNKCSIQHRTFVRKPDSMEQERMFGHKEHTFWIQSEHLFRTFVPAIHRNTNIRSVCSERCALLPTYAFCQNRQESGGIFGSLPPFFCEISIDFPCMKWYNVSG